VAETWVLRFIRCGKDGCWCSRSPDGHGPYWYTASHRKGKVVWHYVGRRRPEASWPTEPAQPSYQPPIDPRFKLHGKMTLDKALSILGFTVIPRLLTMRDRWRSLVGQHHPDRGGNTAVCAAINAAYSFLQRYAS
jgi:hypothetical protein